MTNIIKSVESNNITIKKFKVQGLDLIVTTPNGTVEKIENGLSEIISGGIVLLTEQGNVLSQDEILSSITMNIGADAIYLKEQFISETIELAEDIDTKKDEDDEEKQFAEKLAELNQENQKLAKEVQALESQTEKQEEQLSSSLTKLSEAKAQLKEQIKSEKSKKESVSDPALPPSPPPMPAKSSTSSESSTPANKTPENPIVIKPKTQVFIQGKLSEESDSGKKDDGITNNNKPTFIGTVSLDSQAYLILDGIKYPITADKEGHWSLKITKPLKDGVYEYELAASADGSNPLILKNKIIIDTQLESLSVDLEEISDSGILDDKLTKHNTPTFAGQTEANSTVTLQIAEQKLVTTADAQGRWRITVEKPLADKQHDYTVTAVDVAGNTKTVAETVTIKTTLPAATAQLKDIQGFVTNQTTPTLTGQTEPKVHIQVDIAGKSYDTQADEKGLWSLPIPSVLAEGSHRFTVKVTDAAGNVGRFSESLQIDTTLPLAAATLTEGSDSGVQGDNITKDQFPALTGKTKPHAAVTISIETEKYETTANANGEWTQALPTKFTEGEHPYTVSVTDKAGNQATSKGTFTIDTEVESLSVGLEGNSDSGTPGDKLTKHNTPTFAGQTEANSTVTLQIAEQKLVTTADAQGRWRITVEKPLADKQHDYTVTAVDVAGNTKAVAETVIIKTTLPNATAQLKDIQGFVTNQTTPTLTGQTEPKVHIQVDIAGKSYDTQADEKGLWSLPIPSVLAEGSHRFTVKVTDAAGNVGRFSESLQIDTTLPLAAATLTEGSDSGVQGDNITKDQFPALTGKTKPHAAVTISIETEKYETTANANGEWTQALPTKFTEGEHPYTVSVTDKAGNQAKSMGIFTIDTEVESLSVGLEGNSDSGTPGDKLTKHNTPTFAGQTEANSTVTLQIAEQKLVTTADAQGRWRITVEKPLADKQHDYTVTAVDVAGNTKAVAETVTIKTTLPNATAQLKDIQGFITNQMTPTLTGQTEPKVRIQVDIAGKAYDTQADDSGLWSLPILDALADDVYTFTVTATDQAGNVGRFSESLQIDTQLPSATATLTEGSDSGDKGDNITKDQSPALTGKTKPHAAVTITTETEKYETTANANGEWTQALPTEFTEGGHPYTVSVTDKAGNKAESKGTFIIDTEMTLTGGLDLSSQSNIVSSDVVTNLLRPQISGKSDPNSKITGEFKGTKKTVYCDEQGKWSLTFDVNAKIGKDNEYVITAKDAAGNEKILKQSFSYTPPPEGGSGESPPPTLSVELDKESDSGNKDDFTTNIKTPKFSGTATKGAEVKLYIDTQEYTANADAVTGAWEISVKSLPEGGNPYRVTAEHPGNRKIVEIKGSVTIDTMLPSTAATLTEGSDSGVQGDNITNNKSPELTGKTKPHAAVTISIETEKYETTANANGEWTQALTTEFTEGKHTYTVSVTDKAGNQAESDGAFFIDTKSYGKSLSFDKNVYNGYGWTKHNTPIFVGEAEANSVVTMRFGGGRFSTVADKQGKWHLKIKYPLADNSYYCDFAFIDVAGNKTQTGEWVIIKTTLPSTDAKLNGINGFVTNQNKPMFIGKTDPYSTVNVVVGQKDYPTKADKNGEWSVQLNELADNVYTYRVIVTDLAGNKNEFSDILQIDTTLPPAAATLTEGSDSGVQGDNITHHKSPALTGKTKPHAAVTITTETEKYETTANANGEWTQALPTEFTEGEHTYAVSVTDKAGNQATSKGTFTIDTEMTLTGGLALSSQSNIASSDVVTNLLRPQISGKSDPNSKITGKFKEKTVTVNSDENGDWSLVFNVDATVGKDNQYFITAKDAAGNEKTITKKFEYSPSGEVTGWGDRPTLSVELDKESDSGHKDGYITNVKKPTFTGTATKGAKITFKIAGQELTEIADATTGKWAITLDSLQDGGHHYTVTAEHPTNGKSTDESGVIFIDTTPPFTVVKLTDAIELGTSGDFITKNQKPEFTGKSDPGNKVTLKLNNKSVDTTCDENGAWLLALDETFDKNYSGKYTVIVTDTADNHFETTGTLQIDNTIPFLSAITFNSNATRDRKGVLSTNDLTPIFSGTTTPGSKLKFKFSYYTGDYFWERREFDVTDIDKNGQWSFTFPSNLMKAGPLYGVSSIGVVATSPAGNTNNKDFEKKGLWIKKGVYTIDSLIDAESSPTGKDDLKVSVSKTPKLHGTIKGGVTGDEFKGSIQIAGKEYPLTITGKTGKLAAWNFELPTQNALSQGQHGYTLKFQDVYGSTEKFHSFLVVSESNIFLDPETDSGHQGNGYINHNKPIYKGIAEPKAKISVKVGGKEYKTQANDKGEWQLEVPLDGDGEHNLIFRDETKDLILGIVKLNVLTTPPTFNEFHIEKSDTHSKAADVAKNNNPHLNFTYTGNMDYYEIAVNGKTIKYDKKSVNDDSSQTTFNNTLDLPNGEHKANITAFDIAGNKVEHETIIKVLSGEAQKPKIEFGITENQSVSSDGGELIFDKNHLKITGKTSPAGIVKIEDKTGKKIGTTKADNEGTWVYTLPTECIPSDITEGDNLEFSITAYDLINRKSNINFSLIYNDSTPKTPTFQMSESDSNDTVYNNGLTFSGKTQPNSTVHFTLSKGQEVIHESVKTDKTGNWQFKPLASQMPADGQYVYNITVENVLGKMSAEKDKLQGSLTIKTTPEITWGLDDNDDTGIKGDNITNIKTPKFSGKTEPHASIRLIFDNNLTHSYDAKADENGVWVIDEKVKFEEGSYGYTIAVEDKVHGISGQKHGRFQIDTTAPKVLTGGVIDARDGVAKEHVLTDANIPDFSGHSDPFARVLLNIKSPLDSTHFSQTIIADEKGSWAFTLPSASALKDGEYTYQARVEDSAGNLNNDLMLQGTIKVDTIAPDTLDGGVGNSKDNTYQLDCVTNITKPTFCGSAEPGVVLQLIVGEHVYKDIKVDEKGQWKFTLPSSLTEDTYIYKVEMKDAVGHKGTKSLRGKIIIDTTPPDVLEGGLDTTSDTGISNSGFTNHKTPTFSGTTESNAFVELKIANESYTGAADKNGQWTIPITNPLPDGSYKYILEVKDSAGNKKSVVDNITIDTKAPELSGQLDETTDIGTKGNNLTNDNKPKFSGMTEAGAFVELTIGEKTYHVNADKNGQWTIPVTNPLTDGSYQYTLEVKDSAGNKKSVVDNITIDTKAPELSGKLDETTDTGTKGDNLTNDNKPKFSGMTEAGAFVELKIANESYTGAADKNGQWTIPVTNPLPDGSYKYILEVKDSAGNKKSVVDNITIDTKAPELSGQLDETTDTGTKGDNLTNDNKPKFSGMTEAGAFVELTIDEKTYHVNADKKGQWTIPVTNPLTDGSYQYTLEVKDVAGNFSDKKITGKITIDSTLPDASIIPASTPVESNVVMLTDIPVVDNTISQIDIDNHNF